MAPTATYFQGSGNGLVQTNKNITGVSWSAGDKVVVLGQVGDIAETMNAPTNANLSFSAVPGFPSSGSGAMEYYAWQADAASSQSGQTITLSTASTEGGFSGVLVFAAGTHNGIGVRYFDTSPASGTVAQGTMTGLTDNSFLIVFIGNWSQAAGTPTYRVDQAGAAVNRVNIDNASWGSGGLHTHADAGTGSSKIVGWLTPTGQNWTMAAIEVLAGTAVNLQEFLPDADTVTTGWTATPLSDKLSDASDATIITGALV